MSAFRTASGGRIDRTRPLRFRFDGRAYEGLAGDTLASALLANGVHLVGRSFKYHRPRGILAAGSEEPNALVDRAPRRGARDAEPARHAGRARRRARRRTRRTAGRACASTSARKRPAVAALPGRLLLQDLHVAARGVGRALRAADPPRRRARPRAVAARPGSLRATLRALRRAGGRRGPGRPRRRAGRRRGRRARHPRRRAVGAGRLAARRLRGEHRRRDGATPGSPGASRNWPAIRACACCRARRPSATSRTTASGSSSASPTISRSPRRAGPRERLWQVRAREVVLATGAIERPLVFPGNDRPGVMLAGAARSYLRPLWRARRHAGGRRDRRRDAAYRAALRSAPRAASTSPAIVDLRARAPDGAGASGARRGHRGPGRAPTVARHARRAARRRRIDRDGRRLACDLLLMSGGYAPAVHLFSQSRGRLPWSDAARAFVPRPRRSAAQPAGAGRGVYELAAALADGAAAGLAAARGSGHPAPALRFEVSGARAACRMPAARP